MHPMNLIRQSATSNKHLYMTKISVNVNKGGSPLKTVSLISVGSSQCSITLGSGPTYHCSGVIGWYNLNRMLYYCLVPLWVLSVQGAHAVQLRTFGAYLDFTVWCLSRGCILTMAASEGLCWTARQLLPAVTPLSTPSCYAWLGSDMCLHTTPSKVLGMKRTFPIHFKLWYQILYNCPSVSSKTLRSPLQRFLVRPPKIFRMSF